MRGPIKSKNDAKKIKCDENDKQDVTARSPQLATGLLLTRNSIPELALACVATHRPRAKGRSRVF